MLKTITKQWLKDNDACEAACDWINKQGTRNASELIKKCLRIKGKNLSWLNWYLSRILSRKNRIKYAVYATEQVIGIYERKYPIDKRPRLAIEAAKKVIDNDTEENREAAYAATRVPRAAYAAYAATRAAYAAYAADDAPAAARATYAACCAADASETIMIKILNYGIKLLTKE